jgi:hypothetical protein
MDSRDNDAHDSGSPVSSVVNRGGTGRSGLPNLGNTCYLNAVLQGAMPANISPRTPPHRNSSPWADASTHLSPPHHPPPPPPSRSAVAHQAIRVLLSRVRKLPTRQGLGPWQEPGKQAPRPFCLGPGQAGDSHYAQRSPPCFSPSFPPQGSRSCPRSPRAPRP